MPARTSSFYFKGKSSNVAEIAHALGVANILEGSVRRSGDQLRASVQLVRADTGYHVWSDSYDRELKDVFEMQDEIATAVASALQIALTGEPLTRELKSYDRLFPEQDTMPKGGFGNLIALPLQKGPRKTGASVFVDAELRPYPE